MLEMDQGYSQAHSSNPRAPAAVIEPMIIALLRLFCRASPYKSSVIPSNRRSAVQGPMWGIHEHEGGLDRCGSPGTFQRLGGLLGVLWSNNALELN